MVRSAALCVLFGMTIVNGIRVLSGIHAASNTADPQPQDDETTTTSIEAKEEANEEHDTTSTTSVEAKEDAIEDDPTPTTESITTTTTTTFTIWSVLPGVGWGVAAASDEYTTPLCFHEDTGITDGVTTVASKQSVQVRKATYKSTAEINFAMGNLGGDEDSNAVGSALKAAVKSLLAHTSGELTRGYELLQVHYYVPVVEHIVREPDKNCQSAPISIISFLSDEKSFEEDVLDTFLRVHGTRVVYSVTLGGHLSLFHLQKSGGANIDIMSQKGAISMASTSTHMTILGGHWGAQTSNASSESLQHAVDAWMQTVRDKQNLRVLKHKATPIGMLLPPSMQKRILEQSANTVAHFAQHMVNLQDSLQFVAYKLDDAFHVFTEAKGRKQETESLTKVVPLVINYCRECDKYAELFNSGFVGMHGVPPAMCKSICQKYTLGVCKDGVPRMKAFATETPYSFTPILHMLGQYPVDEVYEVLLLSQEFCKPSDDWLSKLKQDSEAPQDHPIKPPEPPPTPLKPEDPPGVSSQASLKPLDPPTSSLMEAPEEQDQEKDKITLAPSLGWGVLPVADTYTLPVCGSDSGRIGIKNSGVVTTPSNEPLQPMIKVYRKNIDIELSFTDAIGNGIPNPVVAKMVKNILASSNGKLSGDSQLLHLSYYIPVEVQTIVDPASDCWNDHLKDIEKDFNSGNLSDDVIDRFLLTHGTRMASSIARGGRLDIVNLQRKGDVDLSFLAKTISVNAGMVQANINFDQLGGTWKHDFADNSTATMEQAVQKWVESVQSRENLAWLSHTTVPVTALFPAKMYSRLESRVKYVTDGWMASIAVLETALYWKTKIIGSKDSFQTQWKRNEMVDTLLQIVDSVQGFCDITKTYKTLEYLGYVDMSSGMSTSPTALIKFCRQSLLWTCKEAWPKVVSDPGLLQTALGTHPTHQTEALLKKRTDDLCKRLDE